MSTDNRTLQVTTMIRSRISLITLTTLVLLGFSISGGCLSVLSQAGTGESASNANGTSVRATLLDQDADWGPSRGCVWTATFQVSNPGSTAVQGVTLHLELVNAKNGAVRDTKDIFVGTIGPGSAKEARVTLDGECLDEYTIRAVPILTGS